MNKGEGVPLTCRLDQKPGPNVVVRSTRLLSRRHATATTAAILAKARQADIKSGGVGGRSAPSSPATRPALCVGCGDFMLASESSPGSWPPPPVVEPRGELAAGSCLSLVQVLPRCGDSVAFGHDQASSRWRFGGGFGAGFSRIWTNGTDKISS